MQVSFVSEHYRQVAYRHVPFISMGQEHPLSPILSSHSLIQERHLLEHVAHPGNAPQLEETGGVLIPSRQYIFVEGC
jgi:hypothetical protein